MANDGDGRVICPKCGADLGPEQPLKGTLTGCRHCHLWITNKGEIVENPHEHFKQWQQRKERQKHKKEQHKKYVKAHSGGRTSERRVEGRVVAKENIKPN